MLVYLTYLQNIFLTFSSDLITGPGHFWSLAVEEHFYLFWPLLVYLVNTKKVYKWLIGLICLSIITRIIRYALVKVNLLRYGWEPMAVQSLNNKLRNRIQSYPNQCV